MLPNCLQAQNEKKEFDVGFLMAPKSPICHLSMESSDDNLFSAPHRARFHIELYRKVINSKTREERVTSDETANVLPSV